MSDQLSSLELIQISKLIKDISVLGIHLGFEDAEVEAFEAENKMDLPKKKGTHTMMKEWYEKDGSTKAKLIEALKQSGFGKLAGRVQKGIQDTGPSTSGASASTTPEKSEPTLVTAKQLLRLAEITGQQYYTSLVVNLGLEVTEGSRIKLQNQMNLKEAMFEMLVQWSNKEGGGKIADLDKALGESGCGGLIPKYKLSSKTK